MSEVTKQMIACPKCGKEIPVDVWDSIEIPYDIEQKSKIMANTFFRARCEACGITVPISYKCLYNDLEQKYLIWLAPQLGQTELEEIEEYNQRLQEDHRLALAQGGYTYRVVRNDNELREKVLIFDEGLDDRYIETMKLVYVPVFKKNIAADSRIMGLYFDKKPEGDGYQWVILFDKKPPAVAEVNMEIYEDMKDKLHNMAEEKTPFGFAQIHSAWAMELMQQRAEGKTSQQEEV